MASIQDLQDSLIESYAEYHQATEDAKDAWEQIQELESQLEFAIEEERIEDNAQRARRIVFVACFTLSIATLATSCWWNNSCNTHR